MDSNADWLKAENLRLRRALREMVDDEALYGPNADEEDDLPDEGEGSANPGDVDE